MREKKNVKRPSILRERDRIGTERETCLANIIALSFFGALLFLLSNSLSPSLSVSFSLFQLLSGFVERERENERDKKWQRRLFIYKWENNGCKLNLSRYYEGAPLHNFGVVVVFVFVSLFLFFLRKCHRHEGIHESHSLGGTHISVGSVFFEFLWL